MESGLVASHFPSSAECNPYIRLLQSALAEAGVVNHAHSQHRDGRGLPLPVLDEQWLVRHAGRVHVLHFHWLQKLYRAATPDAAETRIAGFESYLRLATSLGYRIAFSFHNLLPHEGMGEETDMRVRRLITRYASVLTCFSKRQRSRLEAIFGALPLSVIPHPNYLGYYPDTLDAEECRTRLGIPAEARVLTFFGLVRPYKQLAALVERYAAVADERAYLVLAGMPLDPSAAQEVEKLVAGRPGIKCCLDWISDEDVQVYMRASDAIVLPYRRCWTSGALMLAFSFGKPVVTADPIMLDEPDGLGFYYTDDDGLVAALQAAMRADDLAEMGARCLAFAQQRTWSDAGARLAAAYRAAAAGVTLEPAEAAPGVPA